MTLKGESTCSARRQHQLADNQPMTTEHSLPLASFSLSLFLVLTWLVLSFPLPHSLSSGAGNLCEELRQALSHAGDQ